MSFRIVNVVASAPAQTVSAESVSTSVVATSRLVEQVVGEGINIENVLVQAGIVSMNSLNLVQSTTSKKITIDTPASDLATDYTYKLPIDTGLLGQVLATDGANPSQLSWQTVSGASSEFPTSTFRLYSDVDPYRKMAFDTSAVALGTTRTLSMPNTDVSLANIPNQTVNTTSSPSFVGVSVDSVIEKTSAAGVQIKSATTPFALFKAGEFTLYDPLGTSKVNIIKNHIGTLSTGVGVGTICEITPTSGAYCFVEFVFCAKNGTTAEIYKSNMTLLNNGGTLTIESIIDIVKHSNWSYTVSSPKLQIKLNQDAINAKNVSATVNVYMITPTPSDCDIVFPFTIV